MVTKKIKETTKKMKKTRVMRQFNIANRKLKRTTVARHFNNIGYSKLELGFAAVVWGGGSLILLPRLFVYVARNPKVRREAAAGLRTAGCAVVEALPKPSFKGRRP